MLYTSKQIRTECGGISVMTEYRWWKEGFPKPIKIRGRNYHTEVQKCILIPKWFSEKNQNGPCLSKQEITVHKSTGQKS